MAGPARFLNEPPHGSPADTARVWQLCKKLTTGQTAITAAQLTTNLRDITDFTNENNDFITVNKFRRIKVQVIGVAANNDAPTIMLHAYPKYGPGHRMASIACAYGDFTSAATTGFHASTKTHKTITDNFAAGTGYRICDTYTVTDYEQRNTTDGVVFAALHRGVSATTTQASVSPSIADFPNYFIVDFSDSYYHYFGIQVTTLAGTTLGAIFQPVDYR